MRSLPTLLLAASVCVGIAVLLTAIGASLALLPEGFGVEWNGVPLSEYDLGDLAGGIVFFGLVGALLAGIHLGRTPKGAPGRRRPLAVGLVMAGVAPLVVVIAIVALIIAVCSGGACS